jgi:ComF family protein
MLLISKTSDLYDATLALLYPQPCDVCGGSVEARSDGIACAACWAATRIFSTEDLMCWKCGAPGPGRVAEEHRRAVSCRRCTNENFSAARACGVYKGALRASVLALKREAHVPPRLARLLLETQSRAPLSGATLVIPIPLHPERERKRGFNQAAVLARAVARSTKLPCDELSLARQLHTERHRAGMDVRARRESVAGAFTVERPRLVRGERILLVDDVFTSGATASACAAVLKEAGASEVFVLTVARAIRR